MNTPFYVFMKLLPKCAVSRAFGWFTRLNLPVISRVAKNWFASYYKLDMEESEFPLEHYKNIGELFIRHLKPGKRPIEDSYVVSPVDGVLSQFGSVENMIQAKGKSYSLEALLRNKELAEKFAGGVFGTIYLAPFNYHRIHSPVAGKVVSASYCPGTLWPVNKGSVERVEGLFCINERLITHLDCGDGAEMLLVKVGATNVGRIAVEYEPSLLTNAGKLPKDKPRLDWTPDREIYMERGQEIARFEMGSTVVLIANKVLKKRCPDLFSAKISCAVRMGERL